jgi:catechol 2,3-dioxygenase-like lactoylglutathione lyase family enzyme
MSEAETFYSRILGLPHTGRSNGALIYEVGEQELRVSPVPEWRPSEHTVVGFAVINLDAVMAALRAKGLVFERIAHLPQDEAGVLVTSEGARVAWVRDPDGNLLSIVQYVASRNGRTAL